MTPEQLKLADCPFCGGKAEIEQKGTYRQSCIIACEDCGCRMETGEVMSMGRRWNTRATPDARVKEALDYIKMADNRLECEGCGRCVSVARSYLVEALAALSHQPGTGEADARNEPDLRNLRMASQIEAERLAHKRAPKSPALDTATVEVRNISDVDMRDLLSAKDVGTGRAKLKRILRALAAKEGA